MIINELLAEKNMTPYRLSKLSGVPYTTLKDIISEKTDLRKCSAETIYRLSLVLEITMEELITKESLKSEHHVYQQDYQVFTSNIQHRIKDIGDIDFIIETIESDRIREYFNMKRYYEALYLLAAVDYLCRVNDIPAYQNYNDIRKTKLKHPVYPSSINARVVAEGNEEIRKNALSKAIPEFLKFNIVECEVRNVV